MKDRSIIDGMEQATKEASQGIVQQAHDLTDAVGERPFGQQFVPLRQQAQQYQLVRNDPRAWAGIIQTHGPKAALEYAQRGERLSERFPEEQQAGQDALAGQAMLPQGGMNG